MGVLDAEVECHRQICVLILREVTSTLRSPAGASARRGAASAIADVLAGAHGTTDDLAVLAAVADLVLRSQLIDAVLLRGDTDERPDQFRTALDLRESHEPHHRR